MSPLLVPHSEATPLDSGLLEPPHDRQLLTVTPQLLTGTPQLPQHRQAYTGHARPRVHLPLMQVTSVSPGLVQNPELVMILAERAAGVPQVKCLECEAEQRETKTHPRAAQRKPQLDTFNKGFSKIIY